MGEGEALLGPLTLGQEGGLSCGKLSTELVGHSLVCLVLMEGVTKLKFAILHLGTTIYDRSKSERSDISFVVSGIVFRSRQMCLIFWELL